MKPIVLLDKALDGDKEIRLYQHDRDFSIKIGNVELMSSRMHASEEALSRLACEKIKNQKEPRILLGGLGMGFSLRAALDVLPPEAKVEVAELIPEVVKWNRGVLSGLAGNPLEDPRVSVHEEDVLQRIKSGKAAYHAILLDVDNGPCRLYRKENDRLYSISGLHQAYAALRTGGVLAVWSSGPDDSFSWRLGRVGFQAEEFHANAREGKKAGGHHVIWLAVKGKERVSLPEPEKKEKQQHFREKRFRDRR